ncbi:WD40 repeat-like protein [Suillus brevipes Sb2]|nr:WD40 repeat-like protein [Suillus brevipes Sb2]
MNPESKIIQHPASEKQEKLATIPYRKIKVSNTAGHILHLPGGQRMITCSWDYSIRVRDLETGTQLEEWDKDRGVILTIALSPDGKKIASGSLDGAVKLWNIDTGKVIESWTGHTMGVRCVSWSSDGGRVVSGSDDGTFSVWDVESGKIILGPIMVRREDIKLKLPGRRGVCAVCYSPDAKMIATGTSNWDEADGLEIWDTNSGELLKAFKGVCLCLAWTSDGKTLIAGGSSITKFDTATWTVVDFGENRDYVNTISLSPNERILASTSFFGKTAQLWNLETNQPIGTPLHHQREVICATFSAGGKFLVTGCQGHIYTWDVSAIVKEAGIPSDILQK